MVWTTRVVCLFASRTPWRESTLLLPPPLVGPSGLVDRGALVGGGGLSLQRVGSRSIRYGSGTVLLKNRRRWTRPVIGADEQVTMAGENSGATRE